MKANELMIGDWVSYYKPDTELVIGRIKKLNVNKYLDGDDEIEVVDNKGCWMTIPNINELQPIPLTGDILENNGFVCRGAWAIPGEDIGIRQDGDEWGLLPLYGLYTSFAFCHIKCVHELQHALQLCEIDKTIEL